MAGNHPNPAGEPPRRWPASYLRRAWRGEARFLPIMHILGGFGFLLLYVQQALLRPILGSLALELASVALLCTYLIWVGLLMWRCAHNVTSLLWIVIAPFAGLGFILLGLTLLAAVVWIGLGTPGAPAGLEPPS